MKQKTEFYQHDWNNIQQLSHKEEMMANILKKLSPMRDSFSSFYFYLYKYPPQVWWASDFKSEISSVFLDTLGLPAIVPRLMGSGTARHIQFSIFICVFENQSWYTPEITCFPHPVQFTCKIHFLESLQYKAFEIFRSVVFGFLPLNDWLTEGLYKPSSGCKKEEKWQEIKFWRYTYILLIYTVWLELESIKSKILFLGSSILFADEGSRASLCGSSNDAARKGKGDAEPRLWKSINKNFRWTQDGLQIFPKLSISTLQLQLEVWSHLQNTWALGSLLI